MGRVAPMLGLVVMALTFGPPAFAKRKKKAASAQKRANKAKKRAFKLFRKGEYEEGIAAMETAYRIVPHPGFLLNIAVAYDQWQGHCADSLVAFDRFFEACAGQCKMVGAATARHAKVEAACLGELAIGTTPPGAVIEIDGKTIAEAPLTIALGLGRHYIVARLAGHEAATEEVRINQGETTRVTVALTPVAAPPPDQSPPPPPPPDGGKVIVQPPPPDDSNPWPWVSLGVGAVGVGVGVLFTVQTLSALDAEEAARQERNTKAEVQRLQRDARSKALVANIGYAVGIVGIGTGVVLLILEGGDEQGGVTIAPLIDRPGLGIAGTF